MKNAYKYLLTFGLGFAVVLFMSIGNGVFDQTKIAQIFAILTDSFTVPTVVLLGLGGLMFVSNEGGFDALSYGITSFIDMFRKEKKNKFKSFYDYKEAKAERNLEFGFLLISGLVFMVITVVMLLLYNHYL